MLNAIGKAIQLSGSIAPELSAKIAMAITTIPGKPTRPKREELQLRSTTKSDYVGALGKKNPVWSWGEGPVVVLCHGWGGRGSQLATMAIAIANAGYKAVVFDATSHGDAAGRRSGFDVMAKDILALSNRFEKVQAFVCHSMGGMSVMTARRYGLQADQFVLIGCPFYPEPIVEVMRTQLKVNPAAIEICKSEIAQQFDVHSSGLNLSWADLEDGHIYQDCNQPTLLIYDQDDKELPPGPLLHLDQIKKQCRDATTSITSGLGHRKLMWNSAVTEQVIQFLDNA